VHAVTKYGYLSLIRLQRRCRAKIAPASSEQSISTPDFDHILMLAIPIIEDKSRHRFNHPQLAVLLCPVTCLDKFKDNPDEYVPSFVI